MQHDHVRGRVSSFHVGYLSVQPNVDEEQGGIVGGAEYRAGGSSGGDASEHRCARFSGVGAYVWVGFGDAMIGGEDDQSSGNDLGLQSLLQGSQSAGAGSGQGSTGCEVNDRPAKCRNPNRDQEIFVLPT